MTKKLLAFVLVAMLLVTSLAAACAPKQVFSWRMDSHEAAGSPIDNLFNEIFAEVENRTDGQLKVTVFPDRSLGIGSARQAAAMKGGLLEVSLITPGAAGDVPMLSLPGLPFILPYGKAPEAMAAMEKHLDNGLKKFGAHMIYAYASPPLNVNSKIDLSTAAAWKGLNSWTFSPALSQIISMMGGNPVDMPIGECYTALSTGLLDTCSMSPGGSIDLKFYEVCDGYYLWGHSTGAAGGIAMSQVALDQLPDDVEKTLIDTVRELMPQVWDREYWLAQEDMDKLESFGMKIVEISPEEIAKAMELTKPVVADWLELTGAEGLTALNDVLAAIGQAPYSP